MGNAREAPSDSKPLVIREAAYGSVQVKAMELLEAAVNAAWEPLGWSGSIGLTLHTIFKAFLAQDDFSPDDLSWGLASALANNYPRLTRAQLKKVLKQVEDETMRQLNAVRASGAVRQQ